jgi:hypothetical protein
MHGSLLILCVVITEFRILSEGLADACDAAMAEYPEAAREKGPTFTVPFDVLMEQKLDEGLCYCEFFGFHMAFVVQ